MKKLKYGNKQYEYDLKLCKRKTYALTITPDLAISLRAPEDAVMSEIERFLKKKVFWIDKQLNFFAQFKHNSHVKEYISGENFLYLGKRHMLTVEEGAPNKVVLGRGKIKVSVKDTDDVKNIQKVLDRWFRERAEEIFAERFTEMFKLFEYKKKPELRLRKMKRRWGSYYTSNVVVLNPMLVHATTKQIDYVIAHELCHVTHKNHSGEFYKLLEEKFPKWRAQKQQLEQLIFNEF